MPNLAHHAPVKVILQVTTYLCRVVWGMGPQAGTLAGGDTPPAAPIGMTLPRFGRGTGSPSFSIHRNENVTVQHRSGRERSPKPRNDRELRRPTRRSNK